MIPESGSRFSAGIMLREAKEANDEA
jgi:hypothetical protein